MNIKNHHIAQTTPTILTEPTIPTTFQPFPSPYPPAPLVRHLLSTERQLIEYMKDAYPNAYYR